MISVNTTSVPVVSIHPSSLVSQHCSWILQRAVGSDNKAESLFKHHSDRDIQKECSKQGWSGEEIFIGKCTEEGLTDVVGVGRNGKRSVMLALAIAVIFYVGPGEFEDLFAEMTQHDLMDKFDAMMQHAWLAIRELRNKYAPEPPKHKDNHEEDDGFGVTLQVVCKGTVPVLTLEKSSVFNSRASWLLQTATGTEGRATATYDFVQDERIIRECKQVGFSKEECGVVELSGPQRLKAVGTTGKRSATMAAFTAVLLHGDAATSYEMLARVKREDPVLEDPLRWLTKQLQILSGGKPIAKKRGRRDSPPPEGKFRKTSGSSANGGGVWSSWPRSSGGGTSTDDGGGYYYYSEASMKAGGPSKASKKDSSGHTKEELDDQLNVYMSS